MSEDTNRKLNILLLTNRDSDNTGDQVIEASDISLIKAAMHNLGMTDDSFQISSHAASLITKAYIESEDPKLLANARRLISASDVVFFGGAPIFNYRYQNFYERTARTIELADEYGKPVIFSAIGIESYDEDDPRCQRLKAALNMDNVIRITTRDGIDLLRKYKEREDLYIDKVADPAVFCSSVYRNYIQEPAPDSPKKIGIFIIRANAFRDNGIDFSWREAADMWVRLISELEKEGYDYELITSGHFGDEAFIDRLITSYGIPADKCVFNINNSEDLFRYMPHYCGVISCRLHPSIISFSMGIPSVSIVWNSKVRGFYESIGYPDRLIEVPDTSAADIVSKLGTAISEGIQYDRDYLISVYTNIYCALRDSLGIAPPEDSHVWDYGELTENLPPYSGMSETERARKLMRKFRRAYGKYNEQSAVLENTRAEYRAFRRAASKKSLLQRVSRRLKRTFS